MAGNSGGSASSGVNQNAGSGISTGGLIMGIAGAVNSAIGAFYAAKTAQYQFKSQAENLKFKADISRINARMLELDAQQQLLAGQHAIASTTMKYGQMKGASRAAMAANGIQLGEGSAAEVMATTELMKDLDVLTIGANAVRAAEATRMQKVNASNDALLSDMSASNSMLSAASISPWANAGSTMLTGGSAVANTWYRDRKIDELLSKAS